MNVFENSSAQPVSPFNKIKLNDSVKSYSFIVSGHFHGQSSNTSTFPAATLLANIDTLNAMKPLFLMSLGDMFIDVDETYIDHYKNSFFSKINFPLFNSVGNHDLSNGNLYEKVYGKTFYSFEVGHELFIVLNTELNDGSIKGEQLEFLETGLTKSKIEHIKNIFIFTHRPIWAERIEKYNKLFLENTRTEIGKNNFTEDVLPLLTDFSKDKNIVWISGSMGGGPASFFYDKNNELNITFMQTAIRDVPRDAVLKININEGKVYYEGISFVGQKLDAIENYNIDYWQSNIPPEKKFNFRLLPYLVKQMVIHSYFWFGFCSCLLVVFILYFFRKYKK